MFFRLQNSKGKSTILSKQSVIYMGSSTKNKKFVSTLFSFLRHYIHRCCHSIAQSELRGNNSNNNNTEFMKHFSTSFKLFLQSVIYIWQETSTLNNKAKKCALLGL